MSTKTQTGIDRSDLELVLESIRDFAAENLPDALILDLDHRDEFPNEIVRNLCGEGLGIHLLFIPEAYGGMGGSTMDIYRVCEALGRVDLGIATGVFATFLGSDPLVFGGTEQQQSYWLSRIASEGLLMAYAATEPAAGSDLGAMRSTAVPIEENGEVVGYRLNGAKAWISNGGYADAYSFLAKAPGGPCWFIVEAGTPGVSHGKPEDKHGIRLSNTTTVTCEDVVLPLDALVGGVEGKGLRQAQAVFGYTRLMVAAFGLGGGWSALDRAIPYSKDRIQGKSPLSEKEGYTFKLIVPHAIRLEAARAFVEETAVRIDAGEGQLNTEGAIAKYLATEFGNAAADASIQALGGYGYTREYMVEKIKRDVRITTIYEGTSEIMEMTIARDRWQVHLRSHGTHYAEQAKSLRDVVAADATDLVGASLAADTLDALSILLERARADRLTRNQHVMLRLGELIAWAETAACFALKARRAQDGLSHEKSDSRFDAPTLAAMSRVFAREASMRVLSDGLRWIPSPGETDAASFAASLGAGRIFAAQAGVLGDLQTVSDTLYARTTDASPAE